MNKRMRPNMEDVLPVEIVNLPALGDSNKPVVVNLTVEIHLHLSLFDFFRQKLKLIRLKVFP